MRRGFRSLREALGFVPSWGRKLFALLDLCVSSYFRSWAKLRYSSGLITGHPHLSNFELSAAHYSLNLARLGTAGSEARPGSTRLSSSCPASAGSARLGFCPSPRVRLGAWPDLLSVTENSGHMYRPLLRLLATAVTGQASSTRELTHTLRQVSGPVFLSAQPSQRREPAQCSPAGC